MDDGFNDISYFYHFYKKESKNCTKKLLENIFPTFPLFSHHIFGLYDKKNNLWKKVTFINHCLLNYKIQLYPSVLFIKYETVEFLINFLCRNVKMLNLFIIILIDEKEPIYWVDFLPCLISLSKSLTESNIDSGNVKEVTVSLYKSEASCLDRMVASEVKNNIFRCVEGCFGGLESVKSVVSKKLVENSKFRDIHGRLSGFIFTSRGCICKDESVDWYQMVDVRPGSEKDILVLYNEGIVGRIKTVKMKTVKERDATLHILRVQLDVMQTHHCEHTHNCDPRTCISDHWAVTNLLHYNSSHMTVASLHSNTDYNHPPSYQSTGKNCVIKMVSLKIETFNIKHVCIKQLFNWEKCESFWKIISLYRNWSHPNIMKFYGFVDGRFAIFRECSTSPLITSLIKGTNEPFTFKDLTKVLLEIGGALHYLHDGLKQYYGNVTLQRIMIIEGCYKLSEPPLEKRIEKYYMCLECFTGEKKLKNCSEETCDMLQLLYSVISIFYINEDMCNEEISEESFQILHCNETMKDLIRKWISKESSMKELLLDLLNTTFTEDEINFVIVQSKNQNVPEFLNVVARDANMNEVVDIDFEQLSIDKPIGKGHFSDVFSATYKSPSDGEIRVAAKKINVNHLNFVKLLKELRPSSILSHPNVLKSIGFSKHKDDMYIITELGEGSLLKYLKINQGKKMTDDMCFNFIIQICEGMQFMSDYNKIIHRDLAARNVIMFRQNDQYVLKISDFGLTILLKDDTDYYRSKDPVSKVWLPPKDFIENKYSLKTDIYSFGVLMWEIFSRGDKPSEGELKKHELISEAAFEIIRKCNKMDENLRPENFGVINKMLKDLSKN